MKVLKSVDGETLDVRQDPNEPVGSLTQEQIEKLVDQRYPARVVEEIIAQAARAIQRAVTKPFELDHLPEGSH